MLSAAGERPTLRRIHVSALALCVVFLPWSNAFLSMAQMLLAANWIATGIVGKDAGARWRVAFASPPAAVFLSFLLLHAIGLLWTEDLSWGVDLCRILLPVLVFGAVLSGSRPLSEAERRAILLLGAWSALASALFGLFFSDASEGDYRGLSMFISHIRLALLLCFSVFLFLHYRPRGAIAGLAHLAAAVVSVLLLSRLESLQGFLILAIMAACMIWRRSKALKAGARLFLRIVIIAIPFAGLLGAMYLLESRSRPFPPDLAREGKRSAGGEPYYHDTTNMQTENGTHVWTYIAWDELRRTWNRRSTRTLDDADDKGHPLWGTCVRYLASKGWHKDSVGLMALTDEEVRAIERGRTNVLEEQRGPIRSRIEEVLFELDLYRDQGIANGHSVAMRLEFLKAGFSIAKAHWLFGVGTGDTQRAFDAYYEASASSLEPRWRLRAHNEYLTLWVSFGVFGLLWALFSWWWPAHVRGSWRDPIFIAWAITFGISCLTDDTTETQAGATFFALYYAVLVFASPLKESPGDRERGSPVSA